jgi:hypothetical protein
MTHEQVPGGTPPARPVYILDTNVLYEFLKGKAGFGTSLPGNAKLVQAIDRLFCDSRHELVVSHVVLMEMISQFFQCSIDLANYRQWHRMRYAAFSPILQALFNPNSNSTLIADIPRMSAINRAFQQINRNVIKRLTEKYQKRPPRKREPKFLDGMDAQILDESIEIARSRPHCCCYLISRDMYLEIAVEDLRNRATSDLQIPRNLFFRRIWALPSLI